MATNEQIPWQLDLPEKEVRFDVQAFDAAIQSHGIVFKHWRAMRCPVGMIDAKDIRKPHPDHAGCSKGYLYTLAGSVTCVFSGNSMSARQDDPGIISSASAQITFPRYYNNSAEEVMVAPFDRLYLDEPTITVPFWQLFESDPSGVDKLNYPVVRVFDLIDANQRRYMQDVEFVIQNGKVVWGSDRPAYDAEKSRGTVCSIRYSYHPYWYIAHIPHEIRVAHTEEDFLAGTKDVTKMPQFAVIQREFFFEDQDNDPEAPANSNKARQVKAPKDLVFGPR